MLHITDVIDSWNRDEFFFKKLAFGKWELTIPALEGGLCRIAHGSSLKVFKFKFFFWDMWLQTNFADFIVGTMSQV